MPEKHHPKRGSKGFSPRKRARNEVPRFRSWPDNGSDQPRLQGFAGYKAGMTHVLLIDYRPTSTTSGQEVREPVTVVEVPPMRVAAVRLYRETPYGLETITEAWTTDLDPALRERLPVPQNSNPAKALGKVDEEGVADVRVLAYTQPARVSGVPRKVPEIMEIRVDGGSTAERIAYARELLGTEVGVSDFVQPGGMVDVSAVTKGKGTQGSVKRWGVKILSHKNSKNRRDAANLGPFLPGYIRPTVPMPGQTGYHQRTEYNKRVLRIGEGGDEITPDGGFVRYGVIRNTYVLLHGSIPGPTKRLVRFRDASRYHAGVEVEAPELVYVSTASKQGR